MTLDRPLPVDDSVRLRMSRQASRDTTPELALRSVLHRLGLRYRVGLRPVSSLRGTADIVFTAARVAVYVDGCFWHMCPAHSTMPTNNAVWWKAKLEGNRARDRRTDEVLRARGWQVVRVWEHEDADEAAVRVAMAVRAAALRCGPQSGVPIKRVS